MAELRMRIFSNRDKQQTLEELEEQINEFLGSVYQVERILQSGGDLFTTVTVWYFERPARRLNAAADSTLDELEAQLRGTPAGGPVETADPLSHAHELAAQGARSLGLEQGASEVTGLDTTFDDLRRSEQEGHFAFGADDDLLSGLSGGRDLGETIAQSLSEELDEEPEATGALAGPSLGPAQMAWEHACELHRLEDGMLTSLERLTAFRAAHPLSGAELMDFQLGEEMLVQMVEQVRADAEELSASLREYALRHGYRSPFRRELEEPRTGGGPRMAGRGAVPLDWPAKEGRAAGAAGSIDLEVQQLHEELTSLLYQLEEASQKKIRLVKQLRAAVDTGDANRQTSIGYALDQQQKLLGELRADLRRIKARLAGSDESAED